MLSIPQCSSFKSISGLGLRGIVDGNEVAVGSAKFLQAEEEISSLEKFAEAASTVFVSVDGKVQGYIELKDALRERAKESVASLRDRGIEIVLASGDNPKTAESIAIECGITQFHGGMLPADKERLVANFQKDGKIVAMLGDGINDAPAIAQANIGMALSTGTDIAVDTADIVLIKGDLAAALRAFNLSKAMVKNIGENLFLAFAYNIVSIPIAAGAFLPLFGWTLDPMVAAIGMSLSSVLVIGNSLRLKQARL
jgi:Cu2+-exporting ATPase